MNKELISSIIARLSDDEKKVMSLPTVQLAILDGDKGITIEKHMKVPNSTIKSLMARYLVKGKPDTRSGVMPLTMMGVSVNERLVKQDA